MRLPDGKKGFKTVQIPMFEAIQSLTRDQQSLLDLQERTGIQLGETALSQSKRLDNLLGTPIREGQLPNAPREISRAPNLQGLGNNWLPELNTLLPNGNFRTGYNPGGNVLGKFDDAGNIVTGYGDGPDIQYQVGADDFEKSRRRVEEALFSRLEPKIADDREALISRLANQGITQGSEAYRGAFDDFQHGVTDARMQALLAGGQEQSRLFGMDVTQGQFYNQAQAQRNAQLAAEAAFHNAAQGQQFGQNQAEVAFSNQAQAQRNAQNAAEAQFFNQGLGQQLSWDTQQASFENQARQQAAQNELQFRDYNNNVAQQNWQLDLSQIQNQQALRQQVLQEIIALRNQPIAETTALLGAGAPTVPQFQPWNAPTLARTPLAESVYNSAALANQQYGAQMSSYNAGLGGMYGLGGTLLSGMFGKSDRRLKQDIKRVGTLDNGLGVYIYRWKMRPWDKPEIGLLADEVEKVHPDAVKKFGDVMYVHYERAVQPIDKPVGEAA